MTSVVRSRIVKIGNSQGIRIPKLLLEQAHLGDEVELELGPDVIMIRPIQGARQGWDAAFQTMAERGEDEWLDAIAPAANAWDEDEWEW
ncbi:MAG: AbrB/MazE/SpoVT family DNA-binding domain-containing protein [Candidatus Promineofilum sp.]|nr:AbrB/MazE/SpoVT family DNA-binding domain-containing protein [Promineifilum sp.]